MFSFRNSNHHKLFSSSLHDETTFYNAFLKDLSMCKNEVIIESPYITVRRVNTLIPVFKKLLNKGVKVYIMTRDPKEHESSMEIQSENAIRAFEVMGIQVLLCLGNHHRKLAILDRKMLWEGSLNILSQTHSREIMRRIESPVLAEEMFNPMVFLAFFRFLPIFFENP